MTEAQKVEEAKDSPDEGRLLTDEEIVKELKNSPHIKEYEGDFWACVAEGHKVIAKAQLAKDMEWEVKTASIKEAECQVRVEQLFSKISEHIDLTGNWWKNLKKLEGVRDEDSGD